MPKLWPCGQNYVGNWASGLQHSDPQPRILTVDRQRGGTAGDGAAVRSFSLSRNIKPPVPPSTKVSGIIRVAYPFGPSPIHIASKVTQLLGISPASAHQPESTNHNSSDWRSNSQRSTDNASFRWPGSHL